MPEPYTVYEVTSRCFQERYLLRPSPELNQLILGVLGRALSLFPQVRLHAFKFMSNHVHLLASFPSLAQQIAFLNHIFANTAREAERLHYLFSHGCKENLVAAPMDWPGVSTETALALGEPLEGIWYDRTGFYLAKQRAQACALDEFAIRYRVPLAPLPQFEGMSRVQVQNQVCELLDRIERETRQRHREAGTRPLGAHLVLTQEPRERPRNSKRSPAPLCHTSQSRKRRTFRAAYQVFQRLYKEASLAFRSGNRQVEFPAGCFLPPAAYCPSGP